MSGATVHVVDAEYDRGHYESAFRIYSELADGPGDPWAEGNLGEFYRRGLGVARDYGLARRWFQKAADQGNIPAQIHLADLYRDGRGVLRDMAQAVAWYRKAANPGDAGAQGTLGLLYSVGMGIPRDDVEAYFWLSLAAAAEGPNQARYMTNRQSVGEHITTDQEAAVKDRIAAWKAAHPRTGPAE